MSDMINKDYYISGLDKKLQDFIIGCIPCLLTSKKAGKQEGFLNPIEKENIGEAKHYIWITLDH